MNRAKPRIDISRQQIIRSRTGTALQLDLSNSQINKSSVTSRGNSADNRDKFPNGLINNLIRQKQRTLSVFKENIPVGEKSTPKQTFRLTKERLKRPLRSAQKPALPKPNIEIGMIHNKFYDYLEKIEKELQDMDELKKHVKIPIDFFSPVKRIK